MHDKTLAVDEYFDELSDYMHGPLEPIESQDPKELEISWDNEDDYEDVE